MRSVSCRCPCRLSCCVLIRSTPTSASVATCGTNTEFRLTASDQSSRSRSKAWEGECDISRGSLLSPGGLDFAATALRERREDIPLLVRHFLEHAATIVAPKCRGRPHRFADFLLCRDYPGNVRDLKRIVMRLPRVTWTRTNHNRCAAGRRPTGRRQTCRTVGGARTPAGSPACTGPGHRTQEIGRAVTNVAISMSARKREWQSPARGETPGRNGPRIADATREP